MSKLTHTCGYKVGIDREITVHDDTFYCDIDLHVEFDSEAEPSSVEVEKCKVEGPNEGQVQAWTTEGRRIEKIIIHGYPEATKLLDEILWEEIYSFASDNYSDIARDVDEDYEMAHAEWHRE